MAIGSSLRYLYHNKLSYFFVKFLGTPDLHSHIRLKPVLYFLNELLDNKKTYHILEIGCGNGVIAFELLQKNKKIKYLGLDNDSVNIDSAKKILINYNSENINFSYLNVEKEKLGLGDRKFDIILFIDVLEHLKDPKDLLKRLAKQINKGGLLIISVPTPLYPKIFGQTFHKKVGHVVSGYTVNLLRIVLNTINSEPIFYKYNTGLFSNIGCAIFYRVTFMNKALEHIKILLLYIFKYFDFFNGEKVSCSLFAVFRLRENGT